MFIFDMALQVSGMIKLLATARIITHHVFNRGCFGASLLGKEKDLQQTTARQIISLYSEVAIAAAAVVAVAAAVTEAAIAAEVLGRRKRN